MTLNEAIVHANAKAEELQKDARFYSYSRPDPKRKIQCESCANEHRQLAEWLKELKAKRELLDSLKEQITSIKRNARSENSDYLTVYISALSAVEGMIAEVENDNQSIRS